MLSLCQSGVQGKIRCLSFSSSKISFSSFSTLPPPNPPALEAWVRVPTPLPISHHFRQDGLMRVCLQRTLSSLEERHQHAKVVVVIAITSLSRVSQLSWWKRGQQNRMPVSPSRGAAGMDYKPDLCALLSRQSHQPFSMPSSPLDRPTSSLSQTGVGKGTI